MHNLTSFIGQSKTREQNSSENCEAFSMPLAERLLQAMNLSKSYSGGQGDYLYFEKNQKLEKALDITGVNGPNLLELQNPRLLQVLSDWNSNKSLPLTQRGQVSASGELARKISQIMERETSEGPWVTHLSSSGTEAIEAAMKHSQLHFKNKLIDLGQEIEKEMNLALLKIRRSEPAIQRKSLIRLKTEIINKTDDLKMSEERRSYLLHQLANAQDIDGLVELIREINRLQLNQRPKFIALDKAYHGTTLGALSLISNEYFRNDFFLSDEFNSQTIFVSAHDNLETFDQLIQGTKQDLLFLASGPQGIVITKHAYSLVAAAFAEPIQGEAGIFELPAQTLAILKKYSLQENFLLIFDEIQSGMFRTGLMAAGNHTDITADYLKLRLEWLQSQFPEIVKEIGGKGLFLALELICDSKMQGHLLATALLNHEAIRVNTSHSNNLTLRIQPSLYFDIVQTEELIGGIFRMCTALKLQDVKYFLSAM